MRCSGFFVGSIAREALGKPNRPYPLAVAQKFAVSLELSRTTYPPTSCLSCRCLLGALVTMFRWFGPGGSACIKASQRPLRQPAPRKPNSAKHRHKVTSRTRF